MIRTYLDYDSCRKMILPGDIALYRGDSAISLAIQEVTRSSYTHAAMLGWAGLGWPSGTMMIGESRELKDKRLVDARSEFAASPGRWDVYRVRQDVDADWCRNWWIPDAEGIRGADRAWDFVCHAAGSMYGYRHILKIWARRRLGRWVPPIPNSDEWRADRFCSELGHAALRAGGGPQVAEYDCDVAPGDLADPRFFVYRFTVGAPNATR